MERLQKHKVRRFCRSKSPVSEGRSLGQENLQLWRQSEALDKISDSSSCSGYSTEEDSFSYKLRRSGLSQTSEAPIKKLLAEELSKEMEPKRRSPSVIGRLMGLDALPPPQPVKKTEKKFSESYLKKIAAIYYVDKRSMYDGRSQRRRSKEHHQEFNAISQRRKNVYIPSKVPQSRVHENDPSCQLPTRIVVLKPNLKKVQNAVQSVSSPDSSGGFASGHRKKKDFGSSERLELYEEVRHRRGSSFELELMKHTTRGSREIAKEITRQMRDSVSNGSKMVLNSRVRGYAGDESSYYLSENDSTNEYEVKTPTSRHFNDWKNKYSPSSSYSVESSVSREARKRLSERWKMTHRSQEVGKDRKGSTLGEMLSMPEKETTLVSSDSIVGPAGFNDRLSKNGDVTRCVSPLGISSRDGWKDECMRSLPRSRSLPASSTSLSNSETGSSYGSIVKDGWSTPKDSVNRHSNSSKKIDSERREGFFSKSNSKPSRKKSSHSFCAEGEKHHLVQDFDLKTDERMCIGGEASPCVLNVVLEPDELSLDSEGLDLSEWKHSILDIPVDDLAHTSTSGNDRESCTDNSNPENASVVRTEESSICSSCTITEVESPASSKEAEQPSPVSVLEPPFLEESPSSSDSFEKISADLHGLRMQLQLLKLESSDAYSEGSEMIVSSDDEITERSGGSLGDKRGLNGTVGNKVNREFSYFVDVLVDSNFHDADLDVLLETWYSPELPVAPSVFDKLEKKYGEEVSWPKSERKLLFDRINLGLMELLKPHMDPHPWVKRGETIELKWNGEQIVEELWGLLVRQNVKLGKDGIEKALMKEMKWVDLGDDVNAVGNEIERLLFDELITEIVGSLVIT